MSALRWIDTHCHLDFISFSALAPYLQAQTATKNRVNCVLPAVHVGNFEAVHDWAHAHAESYCLGIHPLYVAQAQDHDLDVLDAALTRYQHDPRLVAVGEIGLDFFVPELCVSPLRERQQHFYMAQLKLARQHGLPVVLHSRKSVDQVLKGLRAVGRMTQRNPVVSQALPDQPLWHGIAHAFNGSAQQAHALLAMGLKLGFGGACTFERAHQLRHLAATLPLDAIVLETDAPDMPPHWLYTTAAQRAAGQLQAINTPAELPRIGAEVAALRGISAAALAAATCHNALQALPKLGLLDAV